MIVRILYFLSVHKQMSSNSICYVCLYPCYDNLRFFLRNPDPVRITILEVYSLSLVYNVFMVKITGYLLLKRNTFHANLLSLFLGLLVRETSRSGLGSFNPVLQRWDWSSIFSLVDRRFYFLWVCNWIHVMEVCFSSFSDDLVGSYYFLKVLYL